MATEEQIVELARNLKDKHLVASMEDALERARMILQSVPDSNGFIVEGNTTAEAAGVAREVVVGAVVTDNTISGAKPLSKDFGVEDSAGEKSGDEESGVEPEKDDLSKIKKDLDFLED